MASDLISIMRKAIWQDRRTLYRIAKDAGLPYSTVHRFATEDRSELGLRTASILCHTLGLRLVKSKGRKK